MPATFSTYIKKARNLKKNSLIAEKHMLYLGNKKLLKEETKRDYCIMVMKFFEFLDKEDKDIETLSIDDIVKYKQSFSSHSRINAAIPRIADLFEFCKDQDLSVNIHKQDILNLKIPGKKVKKENPPRELTPNEIMQIRQALIERGDIRKLISVELLYGFGLRESDLKFFTPENYNSDQGYYTYNNRKYVMPEYLQQAIKNAPEKALTKHSVYLNKKTEGYKRQINKAGEWAEIKLKIADLTETHKKKSINCIDCGHKYPFEAHYWNLMEVDTKDLISYFPICNCCAEEHKKRETK